MERKSVKRAVSRHLSPQAIDVESPGRPWKPAEDTLELVEVFVQSPARGPPDKALMTLLPCKAHGKVGSESLCRAPRKTGRCAQEAGKGRTPANVTGKRTWVTHNMKVSEKYCIYV